MSAPPGGIPFHIGILPDRPIEEVAELVVYAEELGFAGVWIADSQSIFRDAFAALTVCAARTSTIALATGVTNPLTRHPAVLAGAFATLDEQSGGRAIFGMGVGESAVHTLGLKPARLRAMEEVTCAVRDLIRGDVVSWDGHEIHTPWSRREVPVFFASSGPRSLTLAGRVCDGVLFQVGAEPDLVRYAIEHAHAGARDAGRDPAELTLYARLACSVADDGAWAREQVRGYAAAAAGTVFASVPTEHMPPAVGEEIRRMKEQYDYYEHASSSARHEELVTDRILDSVAVAGTPADAIPRLRELVELGVQGFVVPVTTADPRRSMEVLARQVIPALA